MPLKLSPVNKLPLLEMGAWLHPSLTHCREFDSIQRWGLLAFTAEGNSRRQRFLPCLSKALLNFITTCFNKSWISFPLPFLVFLSLCFQSCSSWEASCTLLWNRAAGGDVLPLGLGSVYLFFYLFGCGSSPGPTEPHQGCLIFKALSLFRIPSFSCAGSETLGVCF